MLKLKDIPCPQKGSTVKPVPLSPLGSQDPSFCLECAGIGYLRRDVGPSDPNFGQLVVCSCKAKELSTKKLAELVKLSNLGRYNLCTFANFQVPENNQSMQVAYLEALEFVERAEGFLVLAGDCGVGKTHLAAAIVNAVLHERAIPAIFVVVPDLLDHLRAGYKKQQGQNEHTGDYDDEFEKVKTCPLLVLDDLGAEKSTDWTKETLYQLLNYRYNHNLATVVTTNKSLSSFETRLQSRMRDTVICTHLEISAPDYRQSPERRTRRTQTEPVNLGQPNA